MKHGIVLKRILAIVFGLCLAIGSLLVSVQMTVFDKSFYLDVYEDLDLARKENISQQDLQLSIFMMIDYVQGIRDDLDGTIVWQNREQAAFNEKEISHMKDVKNLWLNARTVMLFCFGIVLACAIYFFIRDRKNALSWMSWGIVVSWGSFLIFLALLASWAVFDFTSFWTTFHHVFFTNELWLLNPATDFMIVICPEPLFFRMVFKIVLMFGGLSLFFMILAGYYLKRKAAIGFYV